MACRYIRNKNNNITSAIAPNGQRSKLFDSLATATGNIDSARSVYENLYTKRGKELYGADFENFEKSQDFLTTDDNGEPILAAGNGFYYILKKNGKDRIVLNLKRPVRQVSSNLSFEEEREIIDTAISFVNDLRAQNPEYFKDPKKVTQFFNESKGSKGILAEIIATEAFDGIPNTKEGRELAVSLVKIGKERGEQAMLDALPEGVTLITKNDRGYVMLSVYDNWSDEIADDGTGNLSKKGWRSTIQEGLEEYGLVLRDDIGQLFDIDDTPIRIHDVSRLEENPKDKLSTTVKAILTDIRKTEPNSLGYFTAIPLDEIYADMAEATVNQPDFNKQLTRLEFMSKYKPNLVPVVETLKRLDREGQAAVFANFANSYKNFIQFKTRVEVKESGTRSIIEMFPSNRSNTARIAATRWNRQAAKDRAPNDRALYQLDEDGKRNVIDSKKSAATTAYEKLSKYENVRSIPNNGIQLNQDGNPVLTEELDAIVENLNDMLYNMSIQYGPTKEASAENLKKYFTIGEPRKNGFDLYKDFVAPPGGALQLQKLIKRINKNEDIFTKDRDIIKHLASITPYFKTQAADSFLSGAGKTYYPINQLTTLDEIVNHVRSEEFTKTVEDFQNTRLFNPSSVETNYRSQFLYALATNDTFKAKFMSEVLDSTKTANDFGIGQDYESQNNRTSLIARLNAFANNEDKTAFKLAVSTQADRKRMDFVTMIRIDKLPISQREAIKALIVQDLAVMDKANQDIAEMPANELIKGYHYLTEPQAADGPVFTMPQIGFLKGDYTSELRDNMTPYLDGTLDETTKARIDQEIESLVDKVYKQLDVYYDGLVSEMRRLDIDNKELRSSIRNEADLKNFIINDFYGRIEFNKLSRGGMSFAQKGPKDYYKRMKGINTPGTKLAIKGSLRADPNYGMMPTYNAITIAKLDFQDRAKALKIADDINNNLQDAGLTETEANEIALQYGSVDKGDAQSFISLDMYRGIMEGMGEYGPKDIEAYNNHESTDPTNPNAGRYVDNQGNARPLRPVKPYAEELTVRNGIPVLTMDKNSYVTITKELAAEYPQLEKMRSIMASQDIQVVHEENATKGGRKDVRDLYTNDLQNLTPMTMDSSKLRLPSIERDKKTGEITFSRQIRKNVIANWQLPLDEFVEYQSLVSENIQEDTKKLEDELGITKLRNAIKNNNVEAIADAKLAYLQKLRDKLRSAVKERGLPDSYIGALNIVPNGSFDYRFDIPLAFPNYQAKFEQIFFSLFNNGIFKQKLKGKELVQIAEAGGHAVDSELEMYNGTKPAQVMMRRSDLGISENENIEELIANNDPRIKVIGYRIPNQGKNSMLPMQVIRFLPESHEKGIIVPGGVTRQMGSDFDVDKMITIQREEGTTPRNERDKRIFDIMYNSITAKEHLSEVLDPLDGERLRNKAAEVGRGENVIDYNNPLSELDMEMRNKAGIRLRGSWANMLAGHNVAQAGNLRIDPGYAPIIGGTTYDKLGQVFEFGTKKYNTAAISAYLSAAVDAANDPIQVDINDNEFTVPVAGMMLSAGVPLENVIDFLTQPAILEVIQHARDNSYHMGQLYKSMSAIRRQRKLPASAETSYNISLQELSDKSEDTQAKMLDNFELFYKAGMSTARAFKVITPDNLDNLNEISSLRAWLDIEQQFTTNQDTNIIYGAEEFVTELQTGRESVYPIQVAYRGIFNTMLGAAEEAGFINNRPAFFRFKNILKNSLLQTRFNSEQHKFIDRALFLKIMGHPDSPLADYMSKDRFEKLYTDPNNNIAIRLDNLQKSDKLSNNRFFQLLEASDTNNEKGNPVFTIQLNSNYDMTSLEKNTLTVGFKEMLESKDPVIAEFAKDLIANQLMSTGFHPSKNSYMDLIPPEAFTTSILNSAMESPTMFFNKIQTETIGHDFYNDFVHDFIRNFGSATPGGAPLLPVVRNRNLSPNNEGLVRVDKVRNPSIFNKTNGYAAYFITYPKGAAPKVYVRVNGNIYQELQMKGIKGKLNEVGSTAERSSINKTGTTSMPNMDTYIANAVQAPTPTDVEQPVELTKVCRIG